MFIVKYLYISVVPCFLGAAPNEKTRLPSSAKLLKNHEKMFQRKQTCSKTTLGVI